MMINPDNRLFCRLDGLTVAMREQQRLSAMETLGLLKPTNFPVFEEATQTVAHFLNLPVCILSLMDQECQRFKAAVGLSRLGLMNQLATDRQLPRRESFCSHVVDSQQVLAIADTLAHPTFAGSLLTNQFGIRAYLGVPLITSSGVCVGTLAAMGLEPRQFTAQEIEFLGLTARWSMSEFERQQASKQVDKLLVSGDSTGTANQAIANRLKANQLTVELLGQLTQELRTPLTSVMGMASVLTREIYGPLTPKQKEYLDIIHTSGQDLLSRVNEILELSALKDNNSKLNLVAVDIEMLCQQAVNILQQAAQRREQEIRLSVEPGHRIWFLDKDKVRQMLYQLVFSVLQATNADSIVHLHVSHRSNLLNIAVWVSHPCLGEGLPATNAYFHPVPVAVGSTDGDLHLSFAPRPETPHPGSSKTGLFRSTEDSVNALKLHFAEPPANESPANELSAVGGQRDLGLLLSQHLAEMHGGKIILQGALESGFRYILSLPNGANPEARARNLEAEACEDRSPQKIVN